MSNPISKPLQTIGSRIQDYGKGLVELSTESAGDTLKNTKVYVPMIIGFLIALVIVCILCWCMSSCSAMVSKWFRGERKREQFGGFYEYNPDFAYDN
jgi:hypothetical protein